MLPTSLRRPLHSRLRAENKPKDVMTKMQNTWIRDPTSAQPLLQKTWWCRFHVMKESDSFCCDCTDPNRADQALALISKLSHDMPTSAMRSTCLKYVLLGSASEGHVCLANHIGCDSWALTCCWGLEFDRCQIQLSVMFLYFLVMNSAPISAESFKRPWQIYYLGYYEQSREDAISTV